MVEVVKTTKTKHETKNPLTSLVKTFFPILLLVPPAIILYLIYMKIINIPDPFRQAILASSVLFFAALFLEVLVLLTKLIDVIINKLFSK
ncbi:hypothetical protein [Archaeoglobus sp.]